MAQIHKTAIVDKTAVLADTVVVGPYCLIGPEVNIDSGTVLGPYCIVHRWTTVGKNNNFTGWASVGADPQDLKYKGEKTYFVLGDNNIIREYVTLNRATGEGSQTSVGNSNLFMAFSHVGHNCVVGNKNVIANSVPLAGHVTVEDNTVLGGNSAVHQFCRVGKLSIAGGCSKVVQDMPPFSMCDGNPAKVWGLNKIGLQRAGITTEAQGLLKKAFNILFHKGLSIPHALQGIEKELPQTAEIKYLIDFIRASERGICRSLKSAS